MGDGRPFTGRLDDALVSHALLTGDPPPLTANNIYPVSCIMYPIVTNTRIVNQHCLPHVNHHIPLASIPYPLFTIPYSQPPQFSPLITHLLSALKLFTCSQPPLFSPLTPILLTHHSPPCSPLTPQVHWNSLPLITPAQLTPIYGAWRH